MVVFLYLNKNVFISLIYLFEVGWKQDMIRTMYQLYNRLKSVLGISSPALNPLLMIGREREICLVLCYLLPGVATETFGSNPSNSLLLSFSLSTIYEVPEVGGEDLTMSCLSGLHGEKVPFD